MCICLAATASACEESARPPADQVLSEAVPDSFLVALYGGYGDELMQWEDSIAAVGNPFLDRRYPRLDSIISVRLVDDLN